MKTDKLLKEMRDEYYDFPKAFAKRVKGNVNFVFVQDHSVDPFSGGGVLDRAEFIDCGENWIVLRTVSETIDTDQHVFLGLPGFKNFANCYVHKRIADLLYIGCVTGNLV